MAKLNINNLEELKKLQNENKKLKKELRMQQQENLELKAFIEFKKKHPEFFGNWE